MRVLHLARRISQFLMECGGLLVLATAFLITLEILLRQVFNRSLPGVDELAGYGLAVASAFSFAHALFLKAHVRVDTVYALFSRPVRAVLDVLALLTLIVFIAAIAWYGLQTVNDSVRFGSRSQSQLAAPLAIPQSLWLAGLAWFLLMLVLLTLRATLALVRGRFNEVAELTGIVATQEQLEAEIKSTEVRTGGLGGPP